MLPKGSRSDERPHRLRARREALGLSQLELAAHARITRQSLGAIEAGRATPAVDVALRLARALDGQVEDLFGDAHDEEAIDAVATGPAEPGARLALAHVGERWVSLPLSGDGLRHAADALVAPRAGARAEAGRGERARREKSSEKSVSARPLGPLSAARENVVLMGCAAGLGLLADRLGARPGRGRFLWMPASSGAALDAIARGHTHVAGVHVADEGGGDAAVAAVTRAGAREALTLVTLARWEEGLLTRRDERRVMGVGELGAPGVRLVSRERGAGAQRLLVRELRKAGLEGQLARRPALVAAGHLEVARAIAMGAADAGVATRDAALSFGLRFVPLAEERYDLVLPTALLDDARISRLFDVLASRAMRDELEALGYDVRPAGQRVAEVEAA